MNKKLNNYLILALGIAVFCIGSVIIGLANNNLQQSMEHNNASISALYAIFLENVLIAVPFMVIGGLLIIIGKRRL